MADRNKTIEIELCSAEDTEFEESWWGNKVRWKGIDTAYELRFNKESPLRGDLMSVSVRHGKETDWFKLKKLPKDTKKGQHKEYYYEISRTDGHPCPQASPRIIVRK